MELELEPRVKALSYKIRGMSRESPTQKAVHVLDSDLRTHWSTGTNTKEWILLELEEACLLSHIRIHNKSVLEWEIAVGLRFKPDTFLKVRPRCEAPRRDMVYPINYMPCRFVRVSCLRGNPIAIFFVQLIGVPVPGLEQEFQPVVDHLLPHIVSHKQDTHDIYLQLLQDVTGRLSPFLPQLESELSNFAEAAESSIRFLAMLSGPFYPILFIVGERESSKVAGGTLDLDPIRGNQGVLTISSNFQAQPRRVRGPPLTTQLTASSLVFRPDAVLMMLRKAYKDNHLGNVCRSVARLLRKLTASGCSSEMSASFIESTPLSGSEDMTTKGELASQTLATDYSQLFGEDFKMSEEDIYDINVSNCLDVAAVEEGLLHILYACASQPIICRRLADTKTDLLPALPFIQAMLPALRPVVGVTSNSDHVDETFWQWQSPLVQHSLAQIAAVSSSSSYRPLLDACAGYLSSYSPAHARAACVLLDLLSGPLAPWIPMVIAKVDLTIELLEDLLGVIQNAQHAVAHARAALIYIMLALSGHMDDLLPKFKDVKHNMLFLIEMLEPFLVPAITTTKNTIAFGDVSAVFLEKQEQMCAIALDLLRTAVQRPTVLPALENEWRRGIVETSVLLSILAPHVPLPPGINLRKSSMSQGAEHEASTFSPVSSDQHSMAVGKVSGTEEDADGKSEMMDVNTKTDATEDGSLLFAPAELKNISLRKYSTPFEGNLPQTQSFSQMNLKMDGKQLKAKENTTKNKLILDIGCADEYFDLQREYLQLVNHQERELRASEFIRFAEELHGQSEINFESHNAAIDALLLAAECHLNPYFMMAASESEQVLNRITPSKGSKSSRIGGLTTDGPFLSIENSGVQIIAQLEGKRDKTVINILLQAAQWESKISNAHLNERTFEDNSEDYDLEERQYGVKLFPDDLQSADAVTLVREHQGLLCGFLVRQLEREQHNMYEVLLHGLLFFLYSATHLSCPPEKVVDVILQSAERLNRLLLSIYQEQKNNNLSVEPAKVLRIRRQWALLQRIVFAASGNGIMEEAYRHSNRSWYRNLIPISSWMDRIAKFSYSPLPLVRYIGWMGLAHYAKEHHKRRFLITQDMQQLTGLLSIFSDELISIKTSFKGKGNEDLQDPCFLEFNGGKCEVPFNTNNHSNKMDSDGVVHALYPEMDTVFPDLRNQFFTYAEVMLEAVCAQLKAMPPSSIPDILSWFSELCSNPFLEMDRYQNMHTDVQNGFLKGVVVSNVKCILLHILEVIILEHMEAIIPEIPRVIQVLLSLCSSSYCDVPLLDSVLSALKPLISYTVATVNASEQYVDDDPSSMNFESLCFDALINQLESGPEHNKGNMNNVSQGALLIFLAGSLLTDLSISRRQQLMQSLLQWANFTSFQATTTYYNYLSAFQKVLEGCNSLVQDTLRELGISFTNEHPSSFKKDPTEFIHKDPSVLAISEREEQKLDSYVVGRCEEKSLRVDSFQVKEKANAADDNINEHGIKHGGSSSLKYFSCISDVEEFRKSLQALIFSLSSTLELCWKLHPQMACKLSQTAAPCFLYSGSLLLNYHFSHSSKTVERDETCQFVSESEQTSIVCQGSLEGLGQAILTLQQNHCWQVAAVFLEYILSLPSSISLDGVLNSICSALQFICCHAPKVTWRLQTGKWLSKLFERESLDFSSSTSSLVELFCTMLEHSEPEQRYSAFQHLGSVVEHAEHGRLTTLSLSEISSTSMSMGMAVKKVSQHGVVSTLVANTWDRIASLASCEPSMSLRKEAMELLGRFVPFVERNQLQSFLSSVNDLLPGLGASSYSMREGPFAGIGLSVFARACLYCEADDISIIPPTVWDSLELLAKSKNGGAFTQAEQAVCRALLQLREHGEEAKKVLKETLLRSSESTQLNPDVVDVRESVLQVLAKLNAVRSKTYAFTELAEQEAKEMEEAEIEFDLVQEEKMLQEGLKTSSQPTKLMNSSSSLSVTSTQQRLQELRAQIDDMERSERRAEIAARRERQRIARRTRQLMLEEAALREMDLLQDLHRERIAESEREIERQRLLEKERAKTRELRHNLDLEAERRTQREFQRELEQRESGIRSSRREFSTNTSSSRPRERYREREGGRAVQEVSLRPSSSGSGVRENGTTPPATPTASGSTAIVTSIGAISSTPTIVTNSSRLYPVQMSAFSHARDRADERGYEDSFDGMRESSDAGSIGDPETGSALDMMASGRFGTPHRQGSRSNKPRQIIERRERDGRREGKWERKQG